MGPEHRSLQSLFSISFSWLNSTGQRVSCICPFWSCICREPSSVHLWPIRRSLFSKHLPFLCNSGRANFSELWSRSWRARGEWWCWHHLLLPWYDTKWFPIREGHPGALGFPQHRRSESDRHAHSRNTQSTWPWHFLCRKFHKTCDWSRRGAWQGSFIFVHFFHRIPTRWAWFQHRVQCVLSGQCRAILNYFLQFDNPSARTCRSHRYPSVVHVSRAAVRFYLCHLYEFASFGNVSDSQNICEKGSFNYCEQEHRSGILQSLSRQWMVERNCLDSAFEEKVKQRKRWTVFIFSRSWINTRSKLPTIVLVACEWCRLWWCCNR